jgi:hypothetical protein
MTPEVKCAERVNYSLWLSRLQAVVSQVDGVPKGAKVELYVRGYSDPWSCLGTGESLAGWPLPLWAQAFERLDGPRKAQLEMRVNDEPQKASTLTILPMWTWNHREENALATATFVLENAPLVVDLVQPKGDDTERCDGVPPGDLPEFLYRRIQRRYQVGYVPGAPAYQYYEQAVRFPHHMQYRRAGSNDNFVGNCADFAFFFGACLLRAGRLPVICVLGQPKKPEHVLVAIWQTGTPPQRIAVLNGPELQERRDRGLLEIVDPMCLARGDSFRTAVRTAEGYFSGSAENGTAGVLWGVDVKAARDYYFVPALNPTGRALPEFPEDDRRTDVLPPGADGPATSVGLVLERYRVKVVACKRDNHRGLSWDLAGPRAAMGSGPGCHVRVDEPFVSRMHAVIMVGPEGVWLQDMNSSNGTWLRGTRLAPGERARLNAGDEFCLGPGDTMRMQFVLKN